MEVEWDSGDVLVKRSGVTQMQAAVAQAQALVTGSADAAIAALHGSTDDARTAANFPAYQAKTDAAKPPPQPAPSVGQNHPFNITSMPAPPPPPPPAPSAGLPDLKAAVNAATDAATSAAASAIDGINGELTDIEARLGGEISAIIDGAHANIGTAIDGLSKDATDAINAAKDELQKAKTAAGDTLSVLADIPAELEAIPTLLLDLIKSDLLSSLQGWR